MNIRDTEWYAQMIVSGISTPFSAKGSIMAIQARFMRELISINPRELKGGKSITWQFSDNPITDAVKPAAQIDAEAWSRITVDEREPTGPLPSESYEEYYNRLIHDMSMAPAVAKFFADDHFGQMQDVQTLRWMHDARAQRFIVLNSSNSAYQEALPSEYAELKDYITREYPERASRITFRTA